MTKLTSIIIDDEKGARLSLINKIERQCPEVIIVEEFSNPIEAVEFIKNNQLDLLFLDIAMPELSGFDLIKQIPEYKGEIVFVTAYNTYAIEAFKFCALGYILKPVSTEDLRTAVDNVLDRTQTNNPLSAGDQMLDYIKNEKIGNQKISIPMKDGSQFIDVQDIKLCMADDKNTIVFLKDGNKHISSKGIGYYIELLLDKYFFNCHKSYLVNIKSVQKLEKDGDLVLEGGTKVPISRRRRKDFLLLWK